MPGRASQNAVPTFGPALRAAWEAHGWTQVELGEAAGLHPVSVARLEAGDRQPSLELAERLAAALGILVTDFLPPRTPERHRRKLLAAMLRHTSP